MMFRQYGIGGGGATATTFTTITGGTGTRVPFGNGSGGLTDAASFTFNSGTGALTATSFVGLHAITQLSGATNTQVMVGASDGSIGGSANLTYDGTTLTLATGKAISVAADTDSTNTFGRARFSSPTTDEMTLSHVDNATTDNAALRQKANGQTILSSTSSNLILRPNGAIVGTLSSTLNQWDNTQHLFRTSAGAANMVQIQRGTPSTKDTPLYITVYDGAAWTALTRVVIGAADSGETGFRALQVPNATF